MQNNVISNLLARIDAVGQSEPARPAVHVTPEGDTVTEQAVTEAALNPEAGLQVPQMRFDPVLGMVPDELDESEAQEYVAENAQEHDEPEAVAEPDEDALRQAIIDEAMATPGGPAGHRWLAGRDGAPRARAQGARGRPGPGRRGPRLHRAATWCCPRRSGTSSWTR